MDIDPLDMLPPERGTLDTLSGEQPAPAADARAARRQEGRLRRAVAGFEAQFLSLLLKSMRKTIPQSGLLGSGGLEQSTWQEFMDQAVADSAARRGGLGITEMLLKALQPPGQSGGDPYGFLPLPDEKPRSLALERPGPMTLPETFRSLAGMERGASSGPLAALDAVDSPGIARARAAVGATSPVDRYRETASATTPADPAASAAAASALEPGLMDRLGVFDQRIREAAAEAGLRPNLVRAVAAVESSLKPLARSSRGALGLMQLMPATARELGVENPFDVGENLRAGARYLRQLLERFDGDTRLALAGYNAGPGTVQRYGAVPPYGETRRYIEKVVDLLDKLDRVFPGQ